MANIHAHQVTFMQQFEAQGGVAFLLIYYTKRELFYYLRLEKLLEFWKRAEEGGRKSFRMEELEEQFFLKKQSGVMVPYLDGLQTDLDRRDEQEPDSV